VTPSFFALYNIAIMRGRALKPDDDEAHVVVGERLAGLLWPGQEPIGRAFTMGSQPRTYRVIGVAREMTLPTLEAAMNRPEFYRRMPRAALLPYLSLRCRNECPDTPTIWRRIRTLHPAIDMGPFTPVEADYAPHLRLPRAIAGIGGLFAVIAVLTAAGGLFGVLTYAVGQRRREFGIRAALGASAGRLRALIFHECGATVGSGIAAGAVGGWLVARSLAAFHYGVTAGDPVTWAVVVGVLTLTALAAVWRPASQAACCDPARQLRED
jgi:hypothetical protein